MTRTVWKYELSPGQTAFAVPVGSRIVAVDRWTPESDGPAVWVERERDDGPDTQWTRFLLWTIGTGHDVPDGAAHIGSAWCGPFMWHVYEVSA